MHDLELATFQFMSFDQLMKFLGYKEHTFWTQHASTHTNKLP